MDSIFQKFSDHSRKALKNAFSLALDSKHKAVTPQHILYGLNLQKGSIATQILTKAKIKSTEIKNTLIDEKPTKQTLTQIALTPMTKKLIEKAYLIASLNKHKYIGTEHLLASVLTIKDGPTTDFFKKNNINILEVQHQIDTILSSTSKFPDFANGLNYPQSGDDSYLNQNQQSIINQPTGLDLFATELTDADLQKNIDPVIGRQDEIDRLIQILSRRNKNNPLLLGDPGVGKTAIVEGLAKKIITGDVPEILNGKKIYTLDLSLVVAGTSFRGEFENRVKQIIADVKKNPDIILFIDEIHNIIGAGSATGSMDAANILKPALARGEIRCIGATTLDGFKKHIESDPALERRFQSIMVEEATAEKTIAILNGVKDNYEIFHQVKITDDAIIAAAKLSDRYITDRSLPDKAIDLIDEAASAIKIKHSTDSSIKKIDELINELKKISEKKQGAVTSEKYNLALKLKLEEKNLQKELKHLRQKRLKQKKGAVAKITEKDIAKIVAKMTGVPLDELVATEINRLINLEKTLAKKIVYQEKTLKTIAEFIRRSRTGIADASRPIGSFIFLGPSGVGKTETARVLAKTVFGSSKSLIKIDMSEFAESFNISKLIGAPAGYVGYKEGTKLIDAVRQRPYSVVLFDEIEKAHPQIFNLMLQILEDGYLTDGTGKMINFKNTIIIMTSNLGSESFSHQAALGFQLDSDAKKMKLEKNLETIEREVAKKLKHKFPPEFLSRIDKTIVFKPLNDEAITKITKIQLSELKDRLAGQGIKINYEPKVAKLVAKTAYTPETGARVIRTVIQELIENKIANLILKNKGVHKTIAVKVKDNKIMV
ncbi:MAG: ATP-dependent Clp protease ATP-binding subunit ClpC [Parcubacteria group bacterium]|nr:ATP-dependent Clp protease ATP-binding subunit ClpC [Parcubacteria group bacterium]|tara:strand:+ start:3866 stop:6352 length:2487 start_codon:yes stop_codon:yes gene_type:complete